MKVVFLNTSERTGGAAVAAGRLRQALNRSGVQVDLLVREDTWLNRFRFYWERLVIFLCNRFSRKNLFAVSIANTGTDVSSHPLVRDADIIHLHWINQGFLSLKDIKALVQLGKPIVWTMHDMWPATGICHHARDCEKFQSQCEACPFLVSGCRDTSTTVFSKKQAIYREANITFVGCSQWLAERVKQSHLLYGKQVVSIPNPIDVNVFHPVSKEQARSILGFPGKKNLLLFGALNVTDKRKGIDYLVEALRKIEDAQCELVVLGQVKENIQNFFPMPIHAMGYLTDDFRIATLYNAVDVYVTSSLEENLPNMIMESMACGTPCVGFRVGGIPEMIDHHVNGYLVDYKDADDLATGIKWVLDYPDKEKLSKACVEKVKRCYSEEVVAGRYKALYEQLLKK